MKFNREKFYAEFKNNLDSSLDQEQVEALNDFLNFVESDSVLKSVYQLSYLMATTFHESAFTFRPINERGGKSYFIHMYWDKRLTSKNIAALKNRSAEDAVNFSGKGFVQLTGFVNYERATKEVKRLRPDLVRDFESRTGKTFDLVNFPKQAMDSEIAYAVLVLGCLNGWFSGKKLPTYITDDRHSFEDYKKARGVVNGVDKDDEIANYAVKFERVLKNSITTSEVTKSKPVQMKSDFAGDQSDAVTTNISVTKDEVKVETNSQTTEQEKVAIVKKVPENYFKNLWAKVVAFFTGGTILDQATTWFDKVQSLSISPRFWTSAMYFAISGAVIYVLYLFFKQYSANKLERQEVANLIQANSTASNKVDAISEDKISEYVQRGYKIVTRG